MAKNSKSSKKTAKKTATKTVQAPPLSGTWRLKRFPDKITFPPTEEPDGEFELDIDNTGKLKDTSKHKVNGKQEDIIGRASATAIRLGHKSGKRGYTGILVQNSGGVMKLAGFYRITNIVADQEQGTWVGTKP